MRLIKTRFFLLLVYLLLASCSVSEKSITEDQAKVEYDLIYTMPKSPISFQKSVRPVLEKRCVVCHGCYDAPCQLKLGSSEGVARGANKQKVYDGVRITAAEPTRLFIDAHNTEAWRELDFHPVLYEASGEAPASPVRNLEGSVLYKMLRLKQLNPQARTGMLSDEFDLSLDRVQTCPTSDEFDDYAKDYPHGGMPYGLPNLDHRDYATLVHWIAQGAPDDTDNTPSLSARLQIKQWEAFLNQETDSELQSNKVQLVSRYLYEHLFLAHIHFSDSGDREFYRLVRSATPPGMPVDIIASRRPYGQVSLPIYYRFVPYAGSVVAKQHQVYELSPKRLKRFNELFYDVAYQVDSLPSYEPTIASNPIKAFAAIPVKSRYRFLLDEARFFIEGFIKGPVCRGQVALNVIEDQFWVAFFDPDAPIASNDDQFLAANADKLALPSELEDTFRFLSVDLHYKQLFRQYIQEREQEVLDAPAISVQDAMRYLWDGDQHTNSNAALTVFRHYDSASVSDGWQGDYPETAWVMDYSILERIHYLLVAGFDVFGNVGHQLTTRLYMDLLRTEGENYFLAFLPVQTRLKLMQDWYKGIRESNKDDQGNVQWLTRELVNNYQTDNPQLELYQQMEHHLGAIAGSGDYINRCYQGCELPDNMNIMRADTAMKQATQMESGIVQFLPDLAFVRVLMGSGPEHDRAYTMIYNKAYKSVSNMLQVENLGETRDYQFDTQTIVPWLEGSYPNFFYVVKLEDIEQFVDDYKLITNREQYEAFVMRYGIRRTRPDFWEHADWFYQHALRNQPVTAGLFDLNRYQNR